MGMQLLVLDEWEIGSNMPQPFLAPQETSSRSE